MFEDGRGGLLIVRTRIIGLCARALESHVEVYKASCFYLFLFVSEGKFFVVFFVPFLEEGILDYLARVQLIKFS